MYWFESELAFCSVLIKTSRTTMYRLTGRDFSLSFFFLSGSQKKLSQLLPGPVSFRFLLLAFSASRSTQKLLTNLENSSLCCSASLMKGCSKRISAEGLYSGSLVSVWLTKSWNWEDQRGSIGGGFLRTIFIITRCWGSLIYGGSPLASSMAKIP